MRIIKVIVVYNLVSFLVLIAALTFARPYIAEKIKIALVQKYNSMNVGDLEVENLKIVSLLPPEIELNSIKGKYLPALIKFEVNQVLLQSRFTFDGLFKFKNIDLIATLSGHKTALLLSNEEESSAFVEHEQEQPTRQLVLSPTGPMISIEVISKEGEFILARQSAKPGEKAINLLKTANENFRIYISSINKAKPLVQFEYKSKIQLPQHLPTRALNVEVSTQAIHFSPEVIESNDLKLNVEGLELVAKGTSHLVSGEHDWVANVDIPQIEKLPIPPAFLPKGRWSGGVLANVSIKKNQTSPFLIKGDLKSRQLEGAIDLQQEGLSLKGIVRVEADVQFEYAAALAVRKMIFFADLTNTDLKFKELISKPLGVQFTTNIIGQGDMQALDIESARVTFDKLNLISQAKVNLAEPANSLVALQIPATQIKGLEKYIKPLSDAPFVGTFELKARLAEKNLHVQLFDLLTNLGTFRISGVVANIQKPDFKMSIDLANVKVKELLKFAPANANYSADGSLQAQLSVQGQYDSQQPIELNPLTIKGAINATLKQASFKSSTVKAPSPTNQDQAKAETWGEFLKNQSGLPPAQSLLPPWPVLQNSSLSLGLNIANFNFDKLNAQGLSLNSTYNRGQTQSKLTIAKIFQGQINLPLVTARDLFKSPHFYIEGQVTRLALLDLVSYFTPEYKEHLLGGTLTNRFKMTSTLPGTKDWLVKLKASGQLRGEKIRTKDNAIEKVIGEKIAKIAKDKNVLSKKGVPFIADLITEYNLQSAIANVSKFNLLTVDKNEFDGSGNVRVDLDANITGQLYLATVDVGGSVRRANSDASGRLVVPVTFRGSLLNPTFDVAASTIEEMTKNTLKYEAKQLKSKIGEKLNDKKTQEKIKGALKGLFN